MTDFLGWSTETKNRNCSRFENRLRTDQFDRSDALDHAGARNRDEGRFGRHQNEPAFLGLRTGQAPRNRAGVTLPGVAQLVESLQQLFRDFDGENDFT